MTRIYFQCASSGYRAVRGELIRSAQFALDAAGSHPGDLDGVFGKHLEAALKDFQG